MQFSKYNIFVNDYPEKDQCLIFNTRTQALVKIERHLMKVVENHPSPLYFSDLICYSQEMIELHKNGILVYKENEDAEKLEKFFDDLKYKYNPSVFPVTIVTTSACNFRCKYCFEEAARTSKQLDQETCDGIIEWLKKWMINTRYRCLHLVFYGGEPLLNIDKIDYLCEKIKLWCDDHRIEFKFTLQTNGFFLTPQLVDRYVPLGLTSVRISLDGVGERHDRNRVLIDGKGTFDVIMENILDCVDKIKIGISVSYDRDGVDHIEELMEYFQGLGILKKMGKFLLAPVHARLGPEGRPECTQQDECMVNYDDEVLMQTTKQLSSILKKYDLPSSSQLSIFGCPLTRQYAGVTIDQEGLLYRCNSMLGHKDFSIGDIYQDDFNEQQQVFRDIDAWRQCPADCPYLPMCGGGCRLMSFLETKNFSAPMCKRKYLDKVIGDMVKDEYLREKEVNLVNREA